MLHVIDQWHEDRKIEEIDIRRCFAAMMAATEAVLEQLNNDEQTETLQ
jgi:hypothetical protein